MFMFCSTARETTHSTPQENNKTVRAWKKGAENSWIEMT